MALAIAGSTASALGTKRLSAYQKTQLKAGLLDPATLGNSSDYVATDRQYIASFGGNYKGGTSAATTGSALATAGTSTPVGGTPVSGPSTGGIVRSGAVAGSTAIGTSQAVGSASTGNLSVSNTAGGVDNAAIQRDAQNRIRAAIASGQPVSQADVTAGFGSNIAAFQAFADTIPTPAAPAPAPAPAPVPASAPAPAPASVPAPVVTQSGGFTYEGGKAVVPTSGIRAKTIGPDQNTGAGEGTTELRPIEREGTENTTGIAPPPTPQHIWNTTTGKWELPPQDDAAQFTRQFGRAPLPSELERYSRYAVEWRSELRDWDFPDPGVPPTPQHSYNATTGKWELPAPPGAVSGGNTAGTVLSSERTAGTTVSGGDTAGTVTSSERTAGTELYRERTAGETVSGGDTAGTVLSSERTAGTRVPFVSGGPGTTTADTRVAPQSPPGYVSGGPGTTTADTRVADGPPPFVGDEAAKDRIRAAIAAGQPANPADVTAAFGSDINAFQAFADTIPARPAPPSEVPAEPQALTTQQMNDIANGRLDPSTLTGDWNPTAQNYFARFASLYGKAEVMPPGGDPWQRELAQAMADGGNTSEFSRLPVELQDWLRSKGIKPQSELVTQASPEEVAGASNARPGGPGAVVTQAPPGEVAEASNARPGGPGAIEAAKDRIRAAVAAGQPVNPADVSEAFGSDIAAFQAFSDTIPTPGAPPGEPPEEPFIPTNSPGTPFDRAAAIAGGASEIEADELEAAWNDGGFDFFWKKMDEIEQRRTDTTYLEGLGADTETANALLEALRAGDMDTFFQLIGGLDPTNPIIAGATAFGNYTDLERSTLQQSVMDNLKSVMEDLGDFDPDRELELQTGSIRTRYSEAMTQLARQFHLSEGSVQSGQAQRSFEFLYKGMNEEITKSELAIRERTTEVLQSTAKTMTDSLVALGGLELDEAKLNETARQFNQEIQQRIYEFSKTFGLDEKKTLALVKQINQQIVNDTRGLSARIGQDWAAITGDTGTPAPLSAQDLGVSIGKEDRRFGTSPQSLPPPQQLSTPEASAVRASFEAMFGRAPTPEEVLNLLGGGSVEVEGGPTLESRKLAATITSDTMERVAKYGAIAREFGLKEDEFERAKVDSDREWSRITLDVASQVGMTESEQRNWQWALTAYERMVDSGVDPLQALTMVSAPRSESNPQGFNIDPGRFQQALQLYQRDFGNAQSTFNRQYGWDDETWNRANGQANEEERRMGDVWASLMSSQEPKTQGPTWGTDHPELKSAGIDLVSAYYHLGTAGEDFDADAVVEGILAALDEVPEGASLSPKQFRDRMASIYGPMTDDQFRTFWVSMAKSGRTAETAGNISFDYTDPQWISAWDEKPEMLQALFAFLNGGGVSPERQAAAGGMSTSDMLFSSLGSILTALVGNPSGPFT